jgi:hypothetical protein
MMPLKIQSRFFHYMNYLAQELDIVDCHKWRVYRVLLVVEEYLTSTGRKSGIYIPSGRYVYYSKSEIRKSITMNYSVSVQKYKKELTESGRRRRALFAVVIPRQEYNVFKITFLKAGITPQYAELARCLLYSAFEIKRYLLQTCYHAVLKQVIGTPIV